MGVMQAVVQAVNCVKAFRGFPVVGGIVQVSDDGMIEHLDSTYGEAVVCNLNVKPGGVLHQIAPLMFRSMKNDHQQELQMSLQSQLLQGNDVDIDWH